MSAFFVSLKEVRPTREEADEERWIDGETAWEALDTEAAAIPDMGTLIVWMVDEGGCEATDGCWVEPDGTCPHGHQSWLIVFSAI